MDAARDDLTTRPLNLVDEFVLTLFNESTGYFHQVPGWNMNCAIIGAVLAELSLLSRIDTDMTSLHLLDPTETGDPALDPILKEIVESESNRDTRFWVERLVAHAESVISLTLERLLSLKILEHHDGEFYTLAATELHSALHGAPQEGTVGQFVKARISAIVLTDSIPDPRDAIIVGLANACDVLRFMFDLDAEAERRIEQICNLDLIGRTVAEAVKHNIVNPRVQRMVGVNKYPTVRWRYLLRNPHVRSGNIPALFSDLAQEYGPVFQIKAPFSPPMLFVGGLEVNRWVHRKGRIYLRAADYFAGIEEVYGAHGVFPSLDGADHFRLRKALNPGYSRDRLEGHLDMLYLRIRKFVADWEEGAVLQPAVACRHLANTQMAPLMAGIDTQDVIDDLIKFKERLLLTHVACVLPRFLAHTPSMKRRAKLIETVVERVQFAHTPAQRAGCPRNLVDDLLSLHASDPQFLPESNLKFFFSTPALASVYLGDMLGFALYSMAAHREIHDGIRTEADALFGNKDPEGPDFSKSAIDVTHRFIMECLRMYPIIPMSIRNVMNTCVVEGFELPIGTRVHIAQTATHYMGDLFPDPFKLDIDRYLPSRNEHLGTAYAPYGLGTHLCLGFRWVELQLAINLLMIAHHFTLEVFPASQPLKLSPFPSMSPSKSLRLKIVEKRRELSA
ncbi:MAG: cytochrome P450 [Boseongicola sp. SB0675_bin_26]|nr:cytochrome P450 [Boseongicola sp. SB0675_bin_26]